MEKVEESFDFLGFIQGLEKKIRKSERRDSMADSTTKLCLVSALLLLGFASAFESQAQDIGKKASEFVQQELKMDFVYDYMYHLLTQYSKLLQFKPVIPQNATELCSEAMACPRNGNERKFMMESLVKHPAETGPCTMPPPFDPASVFSVLKRRQSTTRRIEQCESKYWRKQNQTGS